MERGQPGKKRSPQRRAWGEGELAKRGSKQPGPDTQESLETRGAWGSRGPGKRRPVERRSEWQGESSGGPSRGELWLRSPSGAEEPEWRRPLAGELQGTAQAEEEEEREGRGSPGSRGASFRHRAGAD